MPRIGEHVTTIHGEGVVIEVYASSFIVRVYDHGDYDVYVNDDWSFINENP